ADPVPQPVGGRRQLHRLGARAAYGRAGVPGELRDLPARRRRHLRPAGRPGDVAARVDRTARTWAAGITRQAAVDRAPPGRWGPASRPGRRMRVRPKTLRRSSEPEVPTRASLEGIPPR